MASYGYPSRGYSAYNDLTPWVNSGIKTSYAADHVGKPVIIDADGRKHPVVSYTSSPEHGHGHGNTGYRPVEDKWHGHGPGHGNTGYGDYSDESSKDSHKPSGHNGDHDNYYLKFFPRMEPTVTTSGGWTRPTRAGWAVPPSHTSLSRPTNDINTAVGYLKESARPTSVTTAPRSRVTVPTTTGPRRDDYCQTVDSREAARRYGYLRSSPVPEERYTGTIDSREAARKYGGAAV